MPFVCMYVCHDISDIFMFSWIYFRHYKIFSSNAKTSSTKYKILSVSSYTWICSILVCIKSNFGSFKGHVMPILSVFFTLN